MSKKVYEHFPAVMPEPRSFAGDDTWPLPTCFAGIEVELEGLRVKQAPRSLGPYWVVEGDASLRQSGAERAYEFKFAQPLCGLDLTKALNKMESYLNRLEHKPVVSKRTSTHVHLDMRECDTAQLSSNLALYAVFEAALFNFVGHGRAESLYCVPWTAASGAVSLIYNEDMQNDIKHLQYSYKYSALNVGSLAVFGTLEFRHMPGLDSVSVEKLRTWIKLLMQLKKAALRIEHDKIPEEVSRQGFGLFTHDVFGDLAEQLHYANFERDMVEQVRVAQDLVHGYALRSLTDKLLADRQTDSTSAPFNKYLEKKGVKGNDDYPRPKKSGRVGPRKKSPRQEPVHVDNNGEVQLDYAFLDVGEGVAASPRFIPRPFGGNPYREAAVINEPQEDNE